MRIVPFAAAVLAAFIIESVASAADAAASKSELRRGLRVQRARTSSGQLRASRAKEGNIVVTLPQSLMVQLEEGTQAVAETAKDLLMGTAQSAAADKAAVARAAAPTTTVATTTMDPVEVARQMNISHDAAHARNLIIGVIQKAQVQLLNRLQDISSDLKAVHKMAARDMEVIQHSAEAAEMMPVMSNQAELDALKVDKFGAELKVALPGVEHLVNVTKQSVGALASQKQELESEMRKAGVGGTKRRVEDNLQAMNVIIPRLKKIERHMTDLERQLHDGDLNKMVEDTASEETMNTFEDVSRSAGRYHPN